MKTNYECRARRGIELRAASEEEKKAGFIYALDGFIPYNSDSAELRDRGLNRGQPFVERIAPDAFKRSLGEDKDIMGFAGHTDELLSAFARIGENLTITTDERGMSWRALAPDTEACRSLRSLIEQKVVRGTSFEFSVKGEGEKWEKRDGKDVRTITEARLYTVNPVAFPAYPESELTVSMRSRFGDAPDIDELATAVADKLEARAKTKADDAQKLSAQNETADAADREKRRLLAFTVAPLA